MNLKHAVLSLLVAIIFAFDSRPEDEKWVTIFNGKDLDGWSAKIVGHKLGENAGNTFRVSDGILSTRYDHGMYSNFNNQFGALFYNKKLTNYRLKMEYRFVGETAKGAPSWGFRDGGIMYQTQSPESVGLNQQFPAFLECNLLGGDGKADRPTGEICANGTIVDIGGKPNASFCTPPTVKRTFHGDQWVTLEIDVQGSKIKHFVNGEEILSFENARYNPANELGKGLIVNGNDRVTSGYIAIQSNSHPMDFRKIELLEYR